MPDWIIILLLILLGFIFLMLELFVIPGFGFMGILGLLCLGGASFLAYIKLSLAAGIIVTVFSLLLVVIAIRTFFRSKFWQKIRLEKSISREAGYSATRKGLDELLGKTGVTLTVLRPVGKAQIGRLRVDVVTEMEMIGKGKQIEVIKVEGNRVVVKEIT